MTKTYIKVAIPGGKRYYALLHGKQSRRSFKTATQAFIYAAEWKERYHKLLIAAMEKTKNAPEIVL